jgi:hypothetical protein
LERTVQLISFRFLFRLLFSLTSCRKKREQKKLEKEGEEKKKKGVGEKKDFFVWQNSFFGEINKY